MATAPPNLLADPALFARRLGKTVQTLTDADFDALEAASNRFRRDVRHEVHETTTDTYLSGDGGRTLNLPAAPVHEIELLEIEGTLVTVGVGPGYDARWARADGILKLTAGRFPDEPDSVRLVYTHGYSTAYNSEDPTIKARLVPTDLQEEIVNLAQYLVQTVQQVGIGVQTLTVGARSTTWSAAAYTAGVTESWARAVDRYKLHQGDSA